MKLVILMLASFLWICFSCTTPKGVLKKTIPETERASIQVYSVSGIKKEALFKRVYNWIKDKYLNASGNTLIAMAKDSATFTLKGVTAVAYETDIWGAHQSAPCHFNLSISVKDGKYKMVFNNLMISLTEKVVVTGEKGARRLVEREKKSPLTGEYEIGNAKKKFAVLAKDLYTYIQNDASSF